MATAGLDGVGSNADISSRPTSPKADIIKSGHLRKQGGARGGRKNWKRRWFILKADYVCYYQEKDTLTSSAGDGPCLGVLALRGAKVISVESPQDDGSISRPVDLPSSCSLCHKALLTRLTCKICQQVFCIVCADDNQMVGEKVSRVCSSCRLLHADQDLSLIPALEQGIVVEVVQKEQKVSSSFFKRERPQHLFALKTKDRELWLAADDADEKAAWISAVANVILSFRPAPSATMLSPSGAKEEDEPPAGSLQSEIDYNAITILEKIGDGAFGEVFKGRLWGTDVAVKTIKPDQVTESVVGDLKKEVAILSQLRHPNIVLYIGACTKPPNVCIVTEWCDRGSLHDVLHDSTIPLDFQRIINLSVGIAQGVNYLHSLEHRIIHRDLKSHNVLVDRNFNVKVADFGLSHVRESLSHHASAPTAALTDTLSLRAPPPAPDLASANSMLIPPDSTGGHYGVFGTPEWMAPEIMEGVAYNQKVDVYSFGIMLSELVTRKLPFRDQYKIKNYMDVVDAVLDDGAMPTLPPWIGMRFRRLIESCLSRKTISRPSFTAIIMKLRSLFTSSPADLFVSFDIPRITAMLNTNDRHNQALAAREIASFKFDHEMDVKASPLVPSGDGPRLCSRCRFGADQHRPLDDDTVVEFIAKLTDMLTSSSGKVVLPAVEALERMATAGRRRSDPKLRDETLRIITERNGIERLIGLVESRSTSLRQSASRALMVMVDNLPLDTMAYRSLPPSALSSLASVVQAEMTSLRENSHRLAETRQQRRASIRALKPMVVGLDEHLEEEDVVIDAPICVQPILSHTSMVEEEAQPALMQAQTEHGVAQAVSSSFLAPPQPGADSMSLLSASSSSSQADLASSAGTVQAVDVVVEPLSSTKLTVPEEQRPKPSWPMAPAAPIPDTIQFGPNYGPLFGDWVLIHDDPSDRWTRKYVVIQPGLIIIYSSYERLLESPLPAPDHVVNASVPIGKKLRFKTGRKYKQPFCFHLCTQGVKWWFALRSEETSQSWSRILPETPNEPVDDTIARYYQQPISPLVQATSAK